MQLSHRSIVSMGFLCHDYLHSPLLEATNGKCSHVVIHQWFLQNCHPLRRFGVMQHVHALSISFKTAHVNSYSSTAPNVAPGTLILRLLLAPDQLCVGVLPQHAQDHVVWERCNLLQAHKHNVGDAAGAPRAAQMVVDLAAAQDDPFDLGGWLQEGQAGLVVRKVPRVVRALAVIDQPIEECPSRHVLQR